MDVNDLQHRIDLAFGSRGLVYWRVRVGSVELLPPPLVEAVGLNAGDSLPSGYAPMEQIYHYRVFVPHSTLAAAGLGREVLAVGTRWWLGMPWIPVVVTSEALEGPVGFTVELRRLGRDEA